MVMPSVSAENYNYAVTIFELNDLNQQILSIYFYLPNAPHTDYPLHYIKDKLLLVLTLNVGFGRKSKGAEMSNIT